MGQCGCGDHDALARFPGPTGHVYLLSIYAGCPDCHTGPGVLLHLMTEAEAERWWAGDLPELDFGSMAHGVGEVPIYMVAPEHLRARLEAFNKEHAGEYDLEGFIHDAAGDALRGACSDTRKEWTAAESAGILDEQEEETST